MTPIRLMTYRKGSQLPVLPEEGLPNSTMLFHIYEQTPGYDPILIVASRGEEPIAKLLGVVRKSVRLFPPSFIRRCEVFSCGEYYDDQIAKEDVFSMMLEHLTQEALKHAFLIEIRNLPTPLFGYRHFRANGYFPINWIRVYNSLHSLPPIERLDPSRKRQINKAVKLGVSTKLAETDEEINQYLHILRKNYFYKIRKHFPDIQLFRLLMKKYPEYKSAQIFLVKYKNKIIGGSFCMFSNRNAYLCFHGGMKKTYTWLHPGVMSVWAALSYAYENGYQHFEFYDAGLPFKKIGYRNFILRFGGKQVSTRRWFRFRWNWLNRIFCHIYI